MLRFCDDLSEAQIVWGGHRDGVDLDDGVAYDPTTGTWRTIADGFAHPGFVPVWTGTQLVLFAKGGAAVYDPATDRWIDSCCNETGGGPGGTPVWTGSTIVLLGSHDPDVGGSTFTPDDPGSSTADIETLTPVETIESDLGLVSFVLPDDVGPYPEPTRALPDFVVGYGRWLVDCCFLSIVLQNLDPPFPDEEQSNDFESNELTWSLYDSGPRDGTEITAKTTTGALTVLVSAQVHFPAETPEGAAQ